MVSESQANSSNKPAGWLESPNPIQPYEAKTLLTDFRAKYAFTSEKESTVTVKDLSVWDRTGFIISRAFLRGLNSIHSSKWTNTKINNRSARLISGKDLSKEDLNKIDLIASSFIKRRNKGISDDRIMKIAYQAFNALSNKDNQGEVIEFIEEPSLDRVYRIKDDKYGDKLYLMITNSNKKTGQLAEGAYKLSIFNRQEELGKGSFSVATEYTKFYNSKPKALTQLITEGKTEEQKTNSVVDYMRQINVFRSIKLLFSMEKNIERKKEMSALISKHFISPPSGTIYDKDRHFYAMLNTKYLGNVNDFLKTESTNNAQSTQNTQNVKDISKINLDEQIQGLIRTLGALHELGIYHRDIKPSNIFVDSDYNLRFADLGLSLNVETKPDLLIKQAQGIQTDDLDEPMGYAGTRIYNKDGRRLTSTLGTRGNSPVKKAYSGINDGFGLGVTAYLIVTGKSEDALEDEIEAYMKKNENLYNGQRRQLETQVKDLFVNGKIDMDTANKLLDSGEIKILQGAVKDFYVEKYTDMEKDISTAYRKGKINLQTANGILNLLQLTGDNSQTLAGVVAILDAAAKREAS